MENTEKKTYNNATLAEKEYYARPKWHDVAVSGKSNNLILTVLWGVCSKDGTLGNFDVETGAETPLPDGADGWEAISQTYVIAYAEEAKTLAKCKGKDLEYIKDICPKTYKSMKRILEWCPDWDVKRAMWFTDCKDTFYANIVRITLIHEEWNGSMRAKAKWTNAKDRAAKEIDTTEARQKITASFGGFFDVKESAPAPKGHAATPPPPSAPVEVPPPPPPPSAPSKATKADCWAAYCRKYGSGKDTTTWFQLIKAFDKSESEFTPGDWATLLANIIEVPF
jgi:hypothetical protein